MIERVRNVEKMVYPNRLFYILRIDFSLTSICLWYNYIRTRFINDLDRGCWSVDFHREWSEIPGNVRYCPGIHLVCVLYLRLPGRRGK